MWLVLQRSGAKPEARHLQFNQALEARRLATYMQTGSIPAGVHLYLNQGLADLATVTDDGWTLAVDRSSTRRGRVALESPDESGTQTRPIV